MVTPPDSEFGYELLVCRWAETAWRPDSEERTPVLVGRQVGTRNRRWDTVVIEVDPEAFERRRAFGDRGLDSDLLHVVSNAPEEWHWYRDALPDPGYPWRYVRAAVHRAAGRDLVATRKCDGRIELRQIRPYPDWVERLVAIENKPDLEASAASVLAEQLAYDVETALADEVWLATESTGETIEPALLRALPVEAGVIATDLSEGVDHNVATVEWLPSSLPAGSAAPGYDGSDVARDVDRRTRRLELAERVYDAGWRSYHETMRPDCRWFQLRRAGRALLPHCDAKGRCPTDRECAGSCESFSPEPPGWRTKGWPIDGGPGQGVKRLLDRRRQRTRDRAVDGTSNR